MLNGQITKKTLDIKEGGEKKPTGWLKGMCDVLLILHEAMIPSGLAELSWIEAKNKQTPPKKEDQHAGDQSPQIPSVSLFPHSRGHLLAAPCAKRVKRKWHCEQFAVVCGLKNGAQSKVLLLSLKG